MPKNPASAPGPSSLSLEQRLRLALTAAGSPLATTRLQRLPDTGLAHDHVRLGDSGWLARVPKQSQLDLPADLNLRYQQACFERASVGGHAPRLQTVLPPDALLPRGALLVEHIAGRPAVLPQDLPALAEALAALHTLPLPAHAAPLMAAPDPLADLLAEIERQARHLPQAGLAEGTRSAIEAGLERLRQRVADPARPPITLVAFDAHPGNFLIRPEGQAVLVDLEKCRYSHPGLDLAHATLYTSTTWDLRSRAVLTTEQEIGFLQAWARRAGRLAPACGPWHVPLRQAMWLWSMTWCAKWRAASVRSPVRDGEDWSAQHSDPALVAHVRDRVDHYLDPHTVQRVLDGFDALRRAWEGSP